MACFVFHCLRYCSAEKKKNLCIMKKGWLSCDLLCIILITRLLSPRESQPVTFVAGTNTGLKVCLAVIDISTIMWVAHIYLYIATQILRGGERKGQPPNWFSEIVLQSFLEALKPCIILILRPFNEADNIPSKSHDSRGLSNAELLWEPSGLFSISNNQITNTHSEILWFG